MNSPPPESNSSLFPSVTDPSAFTTHATPESSCKGCGSGTTCWPACAGFARAGTPAGCNGTSCAGNWQGRGGTATSGRRDGDESEEAACLMVNLRS